MDRIRAAQLMAIERRCVMRANECDRDCANCDLVQDDKELIEAFELAHNVLIASSFLERRHLSVRTANMGYKPIDLPQFVKLIGEMCALEGSGKEFIVLYDNSEFHLQKVGYVPSLYQKTVPQMQRGNADMLTPK